MEARPDNHPQWEYAATHWAGSGIDGMNEMGAAGWEAFAVQRRQHWTDDLILWRRPSG